MPEAYGFPEGVLHLYTGTTAQSGTPIAYVQNGNVTFTRGWQSEPSVSGVYRDHLTGLAAQLNAGVCYTFDKTIQRMFESATAVHAKWMHSSVNGTGGYFLMSGRIDSLAYNGAQGGFLQYSLAMHANIWSAF